MRGLLRLAWVEFKLFTREPIALLFTLAFPTVVLLVLAGVFSRGDQASFRGAGGSEYYVASYLAVVIAAIGLMSLPAHLAGYSERGVLRRFRASAAPGWFVFAAQAGVALLMAFIGAAIVVFVGAAVYRVPPPVAMGQLLLSFTVGTFAFIALGLLIGAATRSTRAAQSVGLIAFVPMWMLSGAGPPAAVLPATMLRIADFMPLTYLVRAVQDGWFGLRFDVPALGVMVEMGFIATALTVFLMRRNEQ